MPRSARPAADLIRLVVVGGAWPVVAGLAIGVGGAFAVTRSLQGLLFETSPERSRDDDGGRRGAAARRAGRVLPARAPGVAASIR